MSRIRRTTEQPVSLFSFQDIITSVTGVMVLLTLLMAVDLIQRVVASPPQQTKVQIVASTQSIDELRAEVADLERRLQTSGEAAEDLPSFSREELKQDRQDLQNGNERLQREIAELDNRLSDKQKQVAAAETASASEQQRNTEELARLKHEIADARQQLESITTSNRIFFRKDQAGKEMWILEIVSAHILAAKIGVAAKPHQLDGFEAFNAWLASQDPASTALYLIVKPDGESLFEACSEAARDAGFDVGSHVMPADQQVIDPVSGAGMP